MKINQISQLFNSKLIKIDPISGGCIAYAYKITLKNSKKIFIKTIKEKTNNFVEEAKQLKLLKQSNTIRVPQVIKVTDQFLVLEWIDSKCDYKEKFFYEFGILNLFGGFSSKFYQAYNEKYPLTKGYKLRIKIYSFYHLINHLNLFGNSYYSSSINIMNEIITEFDNQIN